MSAPADKSKPSNPPLMVCIFLLLRFQVRLRLMATCRVKLKSTYSFQPIIRDIHIISILLFSKTTRKVNKIFGCQIIML